MRRGLDLQRIGYLTEGRSPFYAISWLLYGSDIWIRRDYVEVYAVTRGKGTVNLLTEDGRSTARALAPGQFFFFRPRDTYQLAGDPDHGVGGYVVSIPLASWQSFTNFVGLSTSWISAPDPPIAAFDSHDPAILEPFRQAVARYRAEPSMLDLAAFLVAILPSLLPVSALGVQRTEPPSWLVNALREMDREENLRLGVPGLRALARVSPAHLARVVHRHFGVTPTHLVLELRLRRAAVLLLTTSEGIGTIASRCGFTNGSHFSRAFGRIALVTPREYRRQRLGGFLNASMLFPTLGDVDVRSAASAVDDAAGSPPGGGPIDDGDDGTIVIRRP